MRWNRIVLGIATIAAAGGLATATSRVQASSACIDASRSCVVDAATAYLDALVSHDPSHVRLADSAVRTENGIDTGNSAADIRRQLATGPQYRVVTRIRDVRWFVDGADAIGFYLLDTSTLRPTIIHTATAHISERFHVVGGLITSIEAIDCAGGGPTPEMARQASPEPVLTSLCLRLGG